MGCVNGVLQRGLDFLPDRGIANRTSWKDEMTIEDLHNMASGLACVLPCEAILEICKETFGSQV